MRTYAWGLGPVSVRRAALALAQTGPAAALAPTSTRSGAQTGKKLETADAGALIADAMAVRDSLGCGSG